MPQRGPVGRVPLPTLLSVLGGEGKVEAEVVKAASCMHAPACDSPLFSPKVGEVSERRHNWCTLIAHLLLVSLRWWQAMLMQMMVCHMVQKKRGRLFGVSDVLQGCREMGRREVFWVRQAAW